MTRTVILSVGVAIAAVAVSIAVAIVQARETRDALLESRVQARAAACISLGAHYAGQSWQFDPVPPAEFADYNLPAGTPFFEDGPNQLLAEYSNKAIATGRALQLCLIKNESIRAIRDCIGVTVNTVSEFKVDDDTPRDGVVDNLVC